ncbi:MAG: shikimate kinase [Clostridia bacterium]|nr:shikimate kinase [Clostridia bacterium]
MQYGLIGEKLGHSYSAILHSLLADYDYRLCPMPPEAVDGFMRDRDFQGINVTIPYKKTVIPYLAETGETARRIGSVNTVVKRPDGTLYGDNTDAYGFTRMGQSIGADYAGKKVLVLGSGGTSLTACDVVRQAGGTPVVISRSGEATYADLPRHTDASYLINTTPVGMYPNVHAAPVDLQQFPRLEGVLDVIYNPLRTQLMQQAQALGIPCVSGLRMLVYQAVRACELFTGQAVPPEKAQAVEAELRARSMNLVLVGMPGCGKTTVGEELARLTGREAVDIDALIVKESGMTIPEIFAVEGETGFREREKTILQREALVGGRIIVTGGGAVKDARNRAVLRMNGYVAHITRPVEKLATGGRPLSAGGLDTVRKLLEERAPLYAACADAAYANETTPAQCAQAIREGFDEAIRA